MAIYVDRLVDYHRAGKMAGFWCHMTADSLPELHKMADKIDLKREWFQNHPIHPHYDIRPSKRRLAIANGALEK